MARKTVKTTVPAGAAAAIFAAMIAKRKAEEDAKLAMLASEDLGDPEELVGDFVLMEELALDSKLARLQDAGTI